MSSPMFFGDSDDDEENPSECEGEEISSEEISIGTHICFECGAVEDVFIETPREKEAGTLSVQTVEERAKILSEMLGSIPKEDWWKQIKNSLLLQDRITHNATVNTVAL